MNSEKVNEMLKKHKLDRSIILVGATGIWKTYQMKQLLNRCIEDVDKNQIPMTAMLIRDTEFRQMVTSWTLRLRRPDEYSIGIKNFPLEQMTKVKYLLIDDIGSANATEAYIEKMTYVLDQRIEKGLVTFYTTNLSSSQIEEKMNERISSRISHNTDIIIMDGEDRRKANTNIYE